MKVGGESGFRGGQVATACAAEQRSVSVGGKLERLACVRARSGIAAAM
jgi:hypothetical protein